MFFYNNYIVWNKMHVYCIELKLNIGYVFVVLPIKFKIKGVFVWNVSKIILTWPLSNLNVFLNHVKYKSFNII